MRSRNIYYDVLKSEKLGNILIAATDVGLLKIEFPVVGDSPRALFRKIESEAKVMRDRSKLKDVARQLREFFQGRRRSFEVKFDLHKSTAFSRRVLLETSKIPYGRTVTYGELARRCGCPGGARAIGQVMAKNPLPIIIPCHRVLASDGKLGGYSGGLKYKRILLDLEERKV